MADLGFCRTLAGLFTHTLKLACISPVLQARHNKKPEPQAINVPSFKLLKPVEPKTSRARQEAKKWTQQCPDLQRS